MDVKEWNPATDPHIAANFSSSYMGGKIICKQALQEEMELPPRADIPLLGFVGRLDTQKGADMILQVLP